MQADEPDSEQNAPSVAECLTRLVGDVDAMRTLHRIAERYAGLSRDSFGARELVAEVIEDMLFREAKCDQPREFPPDVVQRAVKRHVMRRAMRLRKTGDTRPGRRGVPRVKLMPLDEASAIALAVEALPGCPDRSEQDAPDPIELVSRIREYARGNAAALRLLELYGRDVVTRRKVLRDGMTAWSYRTARERLIQYATMALCADTAPGSPPVAVYAAATVLPLLAALGVSGRTARTRRAVDRAVDPKHRLTRA